MCCSKAQLKSWCRFIWKLIRRKRPENDDTNAWQRFERTMLVRAFIAHLMSYPMRLEAWRSEQEIMESMTQFCTTCSE